MARLGLYTCFIIVIILETYLTNAQAPPRIQVPGAVLVSRPSQPQPIQRQARLYQEGNPPPRVRGSRPQVPLNALPVPTRDAIRPVVEESEDDIPQHLVQHHTASVSNFDQEAARFGLSALQNAVQQAEEQPEPVQFRPSPQIPQQDPRPVIRQELRQEIPPHLVARPAPRPVQQRQQQQQEARPIIRPDLRQESFRPTPSHIRDDIPIPVRRPVQQQIRQQAPQQVRHQAPARVIPSRPAPQYLDDENESRTRKPVAQILRKYRTDNADGSITWGYENDDGSFKEETIGVDCITRGKYGYVDPDGLKREYNYETSGKCEEPEEELEDLPLQQQQQRPVKGGPKPYRIPAQFAN